MTKEQLVLKLRNLEHEINCFLSEQFNEFEQSTGFSISYMCSNFVELNSIGQLHKNSVFSGVELKVEI